MKDLISRFQNVERTISRAREPFWLFALFLREDAVDRWDLLVSAPWTQEDQGSALRYIVAQLQEEFHSDELIELSRIVLIDKSNPALEAVSRAIHIEHGDAEVKDGSFFGLSIKHAFIITSVNPGASVSAPAG